MSRSHIICTAFGGVLLLILSPGMLFSQESSRESILQRSRLASFLCWRLFVVFSRQRPGVDNVHDFELSPERWAGWRRAEVPNLADRNYGSADPEVLKAIAKILDEND